MVGRAESEGRFVGLKPETVGRAAEPARVVPGTLPTGRVTEPKAGKTLTVGRPPIEEAIAYSVNRIPSTLARATA